MIIGLSGVLPTSMFQGLVHEGVSAHVASRVAHLPPVSTLFAAFLGYNPMQHLLRPPCWPSARRASGGPRGPVLLPQPHLHPVAVRSPRHISRLQRA